MEAYLRPLREPRRALEKTREYWGVLSYLPDLEPIPLRIPAQATNRHDPCLEAAAAWRRPQRPHSGTREVGGDVILKLGVGGFGFIRTIFTYKKYT